MGYVNVEASVHRPMRNDDKIVPAWWSKPRPRSSRAYSASFLFTLTYRHEIAWSGNLEIDVLSNFGAIFREKFDCRNASHLKDRVWGNSIQ